jgi:putative ABC transport system substrate-binding protein
MNLHQRRTFITLLGGAAALPLAVQAQQPAIPVIGFLSSSSAPITTKRISSFGQGLSEIGYTVGRDATVEARMAEGQYDRMPALATDLVSRRVQLIAASGPPAAVAAKADPTAISKLAAVDRIKTRII